jgi:ABC-type transporter Mla subunit MlaD
MDEDAFERARRRITEARAARYRDPALEATMERAREALESLAATSAELESTVPERLSTALREGMRGEVAPVARTLAEVRGLSGQTVRRLERLQIDLDAERRARVEDLALLVDLVSSGWQAADRRLDRLERQLDRLERGLEARPAASVHPIAERRPGA